MSLQEFGTVRRFADSCLTSWLNKLLPTRSKAGGSSILGIMHVDDELPPIRDIRYVHLQVVSHRDRPSLLPLDDLAFPHHPCNSECNTQRTSNIWANLSPLCEAMVLDYLSRNCLLPPPARWQLHSAWPIEQQLSRRGRYLQRALLGSQALVWQGSFIVVFSAHCDGSLLPERQLIPAIRTRSRRAVTKGGKEIKADKTKEKNKRASMNERQQAFETDEPRQDGQAQDKRQESVPEVHFAQRPSTQSSLPSTNPSQHPQRQPNYHDSIPHSTSYGPTPAASNALLPPSSSSPLAYHQYANASTPYAAGPYSASAVGNWQGAPAFDPSPSYASMAQPNGMAPYNDPYYASYDYPTYSYQPWEAYQRPGMQPGPMTQAISAPPVPISTEVVTHGGMPSIAPLPAPNKAISKAHRNFVSSRRSHRHLPPKSSFSNPSAPESLYISQPSPWSSRPAITGARTYSDYPPSRNNRVTFDISSYNSGQERALTHRQKSSLSADTRKTRERKARRYSDGSHNNSTSSGSGSNSSHETASDTGESFDDMLDKYIDSEAPASHSRSKVSFCRSVTTFGLLMCHQTRRHTSPVKTEDDSPEYTSQESDTSEGPAPSSEVSWQTCVEDYSSD